MQIPYVAKRKVELKLPEDQKAILIFDVFKGQITDKVTKIIEENNCGNVHVPNNLTDQFKTIGSKRKRPREKVFKGKVGILVCSTDYQPV